MKKTTTLNNFKLPSNYPTTLTNQINTIFHKNLTQNHIKYVILGQAFGALKRAEFFFFFHCTGCCRCCRCCTGGCRGWRCWRGLINPGRVQGHRTRTQQRNAAVKTATQKQKPKHLCRNVELVPKNTPPRGWFTSRVMDSIFVNDYDYSRFFKDSHP